VGFRNIKLFQSKWSSLCAGLLPIAFLAGCGSSDATTPGVAAGAGGDSSTAGSGGSTAGSGGSTAGSGGSTAGSGGSTAGSGGAKAGSGGAAAGAGGAAAGAGGAAAGAGGAKAGAGGAAAGAGGAAAGAGGAAAGAGGDAGGAAGSAGGDPNAPTTCAAAHGDPGCCSADGKTNYFSIDGTVKAINCTDTDVCTWDATSGYYVCGAGPAVADPSGVAPLACGGAPLPTDVSKCATSCTADADCASAKGTPACDTKNSVCVECTTNDSCKGNASGPLCDTTSNKCIECTTNDDCKGNAKGAVCDTLTNVCLVCLADSDCTNGQTCDTTKNTCFTKCVADKDCTDPTHPTCNANTGTCQKDGPKTCAAAHGGPGCCSADGKTVFYSTTDTVTAIDCTGTDVCTWSDANGFYDCGSGPAAADPANVFPLACGGAVIPGDKTGCPTTCKADADCAALMTTKACDTKNSVCVECVTNDNCKGNASGPTCDVATNLCGQ
jgi:Cys-rich repeat protein